jgi:hypothetical protein
LYTRQGCSNISTCGNTAVKRSSYGGSDINRKKVELPAKSTDSSKFLRSKVFKVLGVMYYLGVNKGFEKKNFDHVSWGSDLSRGGEYKFVLWMLML